MEKINFEGNIKRFVDTVKKNLIDFVSDENVYSEEEKKIVIEKVKSMSDQETLDLYLDNHKYYLEIVPKMINGVLRRVNV